MRWWRASTSTPQSRVFALRSQTRRSLRACSSSRREYLDTSPEGLYYAYSLERMLCKSGLENRFLIAARKKSSDFAPAHLRPKRVAYVRLGELREREGEKERAETSSLVYNSYVNGHSGNVFNFRATFLGADSTRNTRGAIWQTCDKAREARKKNREKRYAREGNDLPSVYSTGRNMEPKPY